MRRLRSFAKRVFRERAVREPTPGPHAVECTVFDSKGHVVGKGRGRKCGKWPASDAARRRAMNDMKRRSRGRRVSEPLRFEYVPVEDF